MSQLLYDQKDNMGNLVGMMLAHTVQIFGWILLNGGNLSANEFPIYQFL
jgi:hypothetical protein